MAIAMTVKARTRSRAPRKKTAPVTAPPEVASPQELPAFAFAPPEVEFAARMPTAPPERTRPLRRRAIFIDVENQSRAGRLEETFNALAVDRATEATDIVASGNWRVISHETARLLAAMGAQLVHSAPAVGVRDWSDLRIAVAAGVWLASAHPGDRLDVVSADRAFDAVGDVAATLGVEFHRHGQGAPRAEVAATPPPKRRGRRAGRRKPTAPAAAAEAAPPAKVSEGPAPAAAPAERVAAPHDELLSAVRALLETSPRGVMLDVIANHLKAQGFERPPNSPRLVTRLRSMKQLRVSSRGVVTLAS